MNLSPNFTLAEFTLSQTAARRKIDNTPPPEIIARLEATAAKLEVVRAFLGKPILISSGYRSPTLNKAVGGAPTSAHVEGWAADFICPGFGSPLKICTALAGSGLKFDQIIEEGTWVHVSVDPRLRGQVLTMKNGRYEMGLTR